MKPIVDIEAERAVLGSVLLSEQSILVALDITDASDFGHPPHRHVFSAMADLARAEKPIDALSLSQLLEARGQLEVAGGRAGISGLMGAVATAANVAHHARRVRDRARLRCFVAKAEQLVTNARTAIDADEFLGAATSELIALTEDQRDDVIEAPVWAQDVMRRLDERYEKRQSPSLETGFVQIDQLTMLKPGNLITLAARPAMGKTALAQNLALGLALGNEHRPGVHVLFVSIEMSKEQIGDRFAGMHAGVDTRELERPWRMADHCWPKLMNALRAISEKRLDIWEPADVSIAQIEVRARRVHTVRPLDCVIVDYLQLVSGFGEGRTQEVGSVSRGLKRLAKTLRVPVVALSQVTRECEKRKPPIPTMADLRESGSIEQDSDVIAFLYRPIVYAERNDRGDVVDDTDPNDARVIVGKNRHGPTGECRLRFDAQYQRFWEVDAGGRDG